MSDSSPWSNRIKTAEDWESLKRETGNPFVLLREYSPEVQNLHAEYQTASPKRRKKIESELWNRHHVLLCDMSSRGNTVVPYLVSYRGNQLSFTEEERQRIKERHFSVETEQISVTLSAAERETIEDAAKVLRLRPTELITQASYLIADCVLEMDGLTEEEVLRMLRTPPPMDSDYLDAIDSGNAPESSLTLGEIRKILLAAHSLRDTQLFTADEIRELGLTPEQREKLGGMIARKQAGLRGVKKPVSGGEQTA